MADFTGLPVFGYVEDKTQAEQIREFLIKLGAKELKPEGGEDLAENLREIVGSCQVLGSLESDTEVEMVLNSMVSLIVPVAPEKVPPVVRLFCGKVSGPEFRGAKAHAILRVLSNLFHGFGGGSQQRDLQYDIYCSMLLLAAKNPAIIGELPTNLDTLRDWFRLWKLDVERRRTCLRLLFDALKEREAETAAGVMAELLGLYTAGDAEKAVGDARECVRAAIADPNTFLFDHLTRLPPVLHLERGDPRVHRLLTIFVSATLQDFLQFYETEKTFVTEELGLREEDLVNKMRILTLMSIGESRQEISFRELAATLNLSEGEELEEFIIRALQSKAVKAKMDQVRERVLIAGVRHRKFEQPQWEELKSRLDAWIGNLNQVKKQLDVIAVED